MSCSDSNLEKSIFIADPDFHNLPEYSEWGYNTFGCYYDRTTFISDDWNVPVKVINTAGKTAFVFTGHNELSNPFSITLLMSNINPSTYADLVSLNNTTIDLTNSDFQMTITENNVTLPVSILNGEFVFKRAQNLLVDDKPAEVILSGTFQCQFLLNQVPVNITNGRFDVGVSNDNFFKY